MFNLNDGKAVAKIAGGDDNGEILYLTKEKEVVSDNSSDDSESSVDNLGPRVEFDGRLSPLLDVDQRNVAYVAGPSGSGKTTYALNLVKNYLKIFPRKDFFLFSRADYKNDPAYQGMRVQQVKIDETILEHPINIETELVGGSILLFDDCNTIQNDKLKKQIDKLMGDIMEVGRKLDITIIITNHLVIPNERKMARTLLNEAQIITVFPKSGSTQQIAYALKTYFGLSKRQINELLDLPSRWVTVYKNYPIFVMYEHGAYILGK